MQTVIETTELETEGATASQNKTDPGFGSGEQLIGCLIVGVAAILLLLVFKLVMLEMEVQFLLNELYAVAGQSPLPKS